MSLPFWNNRIALTSCGTEDANGSAGISLADVLGCDTGNPDEVWNHVLVGSYLMDLAWLLRTVPSMRHVTGSFIVISGEKGGNATHVAEKEATGAEKWVEQSEQLRRINPVVYTAKTGIHNMSGFAVVEPRLPYSYGTHHSKFALCVNRKGLRVAIFTSNLVEMDWSVKSQGVYCQDFPYLSGTQPGALSPRGKEFQSYLAHYLQHYGLCDATTNYKKLEPFSFFGSSFLDQFDFTNAKVFLVASVPGVHSDTPKRQPLFGLHRMAQVTQQYLSHGQYAEDVTLSWQYSSQGVLSESFLEHVRSAMASKHGDTCRPEVQVIYPTEEEVKNSLEGWRSGFSIPVRMRCWSPFLNTRLFRWGHRKQEKSEYETSRCLLLSRQMAMPHIKTYAAITPARDGLLWLLLTSANLSQAAWGTPRGGGNATSNPSLLIRSYELGVVYDYATSVDCDVLFSITPSTVSKMKLALQETDNHLYRVALLRTDSEGEVDTRVSVQLPYDVLHPEPYKSTEPLQRGASLDAGSRVDVPWIMDIPHNGTDVLGVSFADAVAAPDAISLDILRAKWSTAMQQASRKRCREEVNKAL